MWQDPDFPAAAAPPRTTARRPATPTRPRPCPAARSAEQLPVPRPARAPRWPFAPCMQDWKGRRGEGAGASGEMASAPLAAALLAGSRGAAAQPLARRHGGRCPVAPCGTRPPGTDALESGPMTSSRRPANRRRSRGDVSRPLRPSCCTRVSERERAEGAGEGWGRVARMSGEAPPPRLYIKGRRGARRRHFALEWSSL